MNAVLNMMRNIILLEKPACLKIIFTSPSRTRLYYYCSVRRKMIPFSFELYCFYAGKVKILRMSRPRQLYTSKNGTQPPLEKLGTFTNWMPRRRFAAGDLIFRRKNASK